MAKVESTTIKSMNRAGGEGEVQITYLLPQNQPTENCRMFSCVTIPKGASLGVHFHKGDTETYHILQGKGLYTDNDKTYEVGAGDTTFCADGDCHGIESIGDEDLKFIALIIKS